MYELFSNEKLFNIILIISQHSLMENDNLNLKFKCKWKGIRITLTMLKNRARIVPVLRTYYKIITEMVMHSFIVFVFYLKSCKASRI